jgi:hypothetical protein
MKPNTMKQNLQQAISETSSKTIPHLSWNLKV